MLRSPFRRARPAPPPPRPPSAAALSFAAATGLPLMLCEPLALLSDAGARLDERLRAVARLERAPAAHAAQVARLLLPTLSAAPDLASRVHLALLALAPDLAVGRGDDGGFRAAQRRLSELPHDGVSGRLEAGLGRVVALDALAALFGPEEPLPAFLARPAATAPAPYRPAPEILERRRREQQAARDRDHRRELLSAFGLVEDDLDDDPEDRLPPGERHVARRGAPTLAVLAEPAELTLANGDQRVALGVAHPGEWWADLRAGDHQGAMRWHLRLARAAAAARSPSRSTVRKAPRLAAPDGYIVVELGSERIEQVIPARALVPFIEHDDALVVGITLCWSSRL